MLHPVSRGRRRFRDDEDHGQRHRGGKFKPHAALQDVELHDARPDLLRRLHHAKAQGIGHLEDAQLAGREGKGFQVRFWLEN